MPDDSTIDFCEQFDSLVKSPAAVAVVEMVAHAVSDGLRVQGFRIGAWAPHLNGRQNRKLRSLQWRAVVEDPVGNVAMTADVRLNVGNISTHHVAIVWVDLYRGENRQAADAVSRPIVDQGLKYLTHREARVRLEMMLVEWAQPEQATQIVRAAGGLALELTAVLAP